MTIFDELKARGLLAQLTDEEEIKELKENGAYVVTLGKRILRTETAGLVTSVILLYELEGLD